VNDPAQVLLEGWFTVVVFPVIGFSRHPRHPPTHSLPLVVHALGTIAIEALRARPLHLVIAAPPASGASSRPPRFVLRRAPQKRLGFADAGATRWAACTHGQGVHAQHTRAAMPFVHTTDFAISGAVKRPLAAGAQRYMVLLNYNLPRTTPVLWDQGELSLLTGGRRAEAEGGVRNPV
jgi:hypothetical protein